MYECKFAFRRQTAWTDELVAELRQLWVAEQLPASKIAAHLAVKSGYPFTRNSIIGKIHRLGLGRPQSTRTEAERPRVIRQPQRKKFTRSRTSGQFLRLVWPTPAPQGPQVSLRDLQDNQCRYIAGNPAGFETLYCGAPTQYGSYCGYHAHVCSRNGANLAAAPSEAVTTPLIVSGDGLALSQESA